MQDVRAYLPSVVGAEGAAVVGEVDAVVRGPVIDLVLVSDGWMDVFETR